MELIHRSRSQSDDTVPELGHTLDTSQSQKGLTELPRGPEMCLQVKESNHWMDTETLSCTETKILMETHKYVCLHVCDTHALTQTHKPTEHNPIPFHSLSVLLKSTLISSCPVIVPSERSRFLQNHLEDKRETC